MTNLVRVLIEKMWSMLDKVHWADFEPRGHLVEMEGMLNGKHVILDVSLHTYVPRDNFGPGGKFYIKDRRRKVRAKDRDENGKRYWIFVDEKVEQYEMSPADQKFIYNAYVHWHLTARQISKVSGIPEPYIFRYIKHKKLKPKQEELPKDQRVQRIDLEDSYHLKESALEEDLRPLTDLNPEGIEDRNFRIRPYNMRSEWKLLREDKGVKLQAEVIEEDYGDEVTSSESSTDVNVKKMHQTINDRSKPKKKKK